jgi:N-sulfoglucosamine sulfohydrolase
MHTALFQRLEKGAPILPIVGTLAALALAAAAERPNIVWIVAEDLSPRLGCYGDALARTPHLDALAAQGARFDRAFTHAPVCAPSRSGLVTGRYPTSIGSHHMRSTLLKPPVLFTELLQKAGYEVHWPGKTDFNFKPPEGAFTDTKDLRKLETIREPFFAYFNLNVTHESQFRLPPDRHAKNVKRLTQADRQDPDRMRIPPYFPDAPEVRRDIAQHYEDVTAMDYDAGDILRFLDERKLADRTVVFFFGDHGWGLPRGKRWLYDSGLRVPLLVRWPGVIEPGTVRSDLVCFLDFAPTALALAGAAAPESFDGRTFLGPGAGPEPPFLFAARDRMDENQDRCRSVRGPRFRYIRNFEPEKPWGLYQAYNFKTPTMQVWYRMAAEGRLDDAQRIFWSDRKPAEELYDTEADPHEVRNLAGDPEHAERLAEMRAALDAWILRTGDLGAVPEKELIAGGLVANRLAEYEKRKDDPDAARFPWPPAITPAPSNGNQQRSKR